MSPDTSIYDFFVKDDNLETAMELSENIKEFKKDMHKLFWSEFNSQLSLKIKSSSFSAEWKLIPYPLTRPLKDWQKSFLSPTHHLREKPNYLMFCFGQGGPEGGYPLFWGVRCNDQPKEFYSLETDSLSAKLVSKGISITEQNWINWGWYKRTIYSGDTLRRIYLDRTGLIEEITKNICDLFSEIRPFMEQINTEIATN